MRPLYGDANDIRARAERAEELARHAASTTKPIADSGWTNKFTSAIGYYFLRERGEDPADASIIEYQGGERAYISGADDNFYKEWTSGRFEFLGPFTASDFEQPIRLRDSLRYSLNVITLMADQLDTWARQSREGGWSTHQVDPMRAKADVLRREAAALREALTPKGEQS